MDKHFNCVVCDARGMHDEKKENSLEGEDSIVRKNGQAYFFLRHVIKMPSSQIESYLVLCSTGGGMGTENMSTWIWFCRDCRSSVLELEKIHRRITQLQKESIRLEELIMLKMGSLNTCKKSVFGCLGDNNEQEGDKDQCAILNVTQEVQRFVKIKMKQGILEDLDGLDLDMDTIKTEGMEDNWLVGNDDDEFSPYRREDNEDNNDCEDDDDYNFKLPSSKHLKTKRRKRKAALPRRPPSFPTSNSASTDESGEEDEGQEYTKPFKMLYTCSIETCDGSQEKMDVDTFLEHWIYHKKLTSQCTKCSKIFTPGITKNAHWRVSHNDVWKSTPKPEYFREIPSILPEIHWFCPSPECANQTTPFSTEDLCKQHILETHLTSDPPGKFQKLCEICDKSDFYSKDEYKIHQCVAHGIPPKRNKIISHLKAAPPRPPSDPEKFVECADCPEKFPTAMELQHHRIKIHDKDYFKCKICEKEYKYRKFFLSHMKFSHGEDQLEKVDDEPEGLQKMETNDGLSVDQEAVGSEIQEENELVSQINIENPWKCNIQTCPKRKMETMTVDQFLDHWGIHKRQKWKCTKCGRHFAPGITRKSHWPLRHSKIMKSIPEENWFEQICPVTPSIKWPCPLFPDCRDDFTDVELRSTHVTVYHPQFSLEQNCKDCNLKLWTEDELKFHVTTVHKMNTPKRPGTRPRGDFNCDDCPSKFNTAIKLQHHRIREHRTDSFKCEICGNEYKFRQTLTNHMSFAHGYKHRQKKDKEPNICKICGKEFPWKTNLAQHLAGVHKMDNLACEICGDSVPRHLLEKHLFKEHGIGNVKHWVCEVEGCGRIFYKKYDLKFHKNNTHEKWKGAKAEFQCEECGKEFHVKTYLNSHMKLHRGKHELPWQCDKCEKRFAREDYLRNHKISQHGEGQVVKRRKRVKKEDLDNLSF